MNFKEYADREMLAMGLADTLASALRKCLSMHDIASFAVPGGTTPGPVFDILSAVDLDWSRVHVMLTDERWVPEDDPRSNTRLVKDRLLTGRAAAAHFVPFYRDGLDPIDGAAEVAPTLEAAMPLSLLLLGMGSDMHTASLFPGAPGTAEAMTSASPLLCPVSPAGEVPRVSLPSHALSQSMDCHVVITGQEKRDAIERARQLSADEAPISLVLGISTIHWAA